MIPLSIGIPVLICLLVALPIVKIYRAKKLLKDQKRIEAEQTDPKSLSKLWDKMISRSPAFYEAWGMGLMLFSIAGFFLTFFLYMRTGFSAACSVALGISYASVVLSFLFFKSPTLYKDTPGKKARWMKYQKHSNHRFYAVISPILFLGIFAGKQISVSPWFQIIFLGGMFGFSLMVFGEYFVLR